MHEIIPNWAVQSLVILVTCFNRGEKMTPLLVSCRCEATVLLFCCCCYYYFSNVNTEFIEVTLQRGSPAGELEPIAAYRLGVFMRWVEKSQEDHWVG
jgi:hypothetical protein